MIQAEMLKHRIDKRELAKLAGINPFRLNRILHSGFNPTIGECLSIAAALNVSPYFLFGVNHLRELPVCSTGNVAI